MTATPPPPPPPPLLPPPTPPPPPPAAAAAAAAAVAAAAALSPLSPIMGSICVAESRWNFLDILQSGTRESMFWRRIIFCIEMTRVFGIQYRVVQSFKKKPCHCQGEDGHESCNYLKYMDCKFLQGTIFVAVGCLNISARQA